MALVFLDIAVSLHVSSQVRAVGKGARANVALERLLARVGSNVTLQEPRSAETFAANFALARQRVSANVHLERSKRRVRLFAVFAREMFLNLGAAMKLLVFGEAAKSRIALATAVALVAGQTVLAVRSRSRRDGQLGGRLGLSLSDGRRNVRLFVLQLEWHRVGRMKRLFGRRREARLGRGGHLERLAVLLGVKGRRCGRVGRG